MDRNGVGLYCDSIRALDVHGRCVETPPADRNSFGKARILLNGRLHEANHRYFDDRVWHYLLF